MNKLFPIALSEFKISQELVIREAQSQTSLFNSTRAAVIVLGGGKNTTIPGKMTSVAEHENVSC